MLWHSLETFLEKPLESLASKAMVVELMDSHGLKKLEMREGGGFDEHDHDDHDEGDHKEHDEHDEDGHKEHDWNQIIQNHQKEILRHGLD